MSRSAKGTVSSVSRPASILRQVQDVRHQARQALRAVHHLVQVVAARVAVQVRLLQQPRQADEAVQRRADLVADVGQERALGAVGRLRLVLGLRQRGFDAPALGHVFHDPDRATAAGVVRVHGPRQDPAQEAAAVAAPHQAFDLDLFARRQARTELRGRRPRSPPAGPHHVAGLADQLARGPAEHLLHQPVGLHETPVARQRDADRRVLQDRRMDQPRALGVADVARIDDQVGHPVHHERRRRQQHGDRLPAPVDEARRQVADAAVLAQRFDQPIAVGDVLPDAELFRACVPALRRPCSR